MFICIKMFGYTLFEMLVWILNSLKKPEAEYFRQSQLRELYTYISEIYPKINFQICIVIQNYTQNDITLDTNTTIKYKQS